jgi:hypothetical protein
MRRILWGGRKRRKFFFLFFSFFDRICLFSPSERSGRCLNFLSFPSHQTHVSLLPSVEATVPGKIERNSRIEKTFSPTTLNLSISFVSDAVEKAANNTTKTFGDD